MKRQLRHHTYSSRLATANSLGALERPSGHHYLDRANYLPPLEAYRYQLVACQDKIDMLLLRPVSRPPPPLMLDELRTCVCIELKTQVIARGVRSRG